MRFVRFPSPSAIFMFTVVASTSTVPGAEVVPRGWEGLKRDARSPDRATRLFRTTRESAAGPS